MIIAFDVDDTLIVPGVVTGLEYDTPNEDTINIYKWFQTQGNHMIVWSGGGVEYAKRWADRLGLQPDEIVAKEMYRNKAGTPQVDIAFDDCDVDLAKVNVKVKRLKNSISRKDWNKHDG